MKLEILENQHDVLTLHIWDALNVKINRANLCLTSAEKCSNHEFLLQQLKNCQGGKNLTQKLSRGPTTWKDMMLRTGEQES